MVAHCIPGLPAQDLKTSGATAGRVSGGGAGSASADRVGSTVGTGVGVGVAVGCGVALHPLMTASAVTAASPVHNLERTRATLSCPPMPATLASDTAFAT